MKLKSISIENWKSIIYTKLMLKNLLILIGENNSGKSVLISALMFFLDPKDFTEDYVKNTRLPMRITGTFINDESEEIELSIVKMPMDDNLIFRLKTLRDDSVVSEDEFRKITGKFKILYVPSDLDSPEPETRKEEVKNFLDIFSEVLKEAAPNSNFTPEIIRDKYLDLTRLYTSKSIFRNIIFEIIKYFLKTALDSNVENVKNLYIFFEHPEMFLHPQAERELFDALIKLSNMGVFITVETHSSRFVGLKQYSGICIARNKENESTYFQYRGQLFSGDEVKNFNMNYWINTDRGELFFAKKVILVEGQTDKMILGYLGKTLKIFNYEYTIVECGSKSIIPQFIKLLNSFKIPYVAVYDKDNHPWRTAVELGNSKIKNKSIQASINYEIGKYIEFENDIEEEVYGEGREKKNYRNKPFNAIMHVMDETYKIPSELEQKIKKIYL